MPGARLGASRTMYIRCNGWRGKAYAFASSPARLSGGIIGAVGEVSGKPWIVLVAEVAQ